MTFNPYTATLMPLQGKHYGTVISLRDKTGCDSKIKLWISDPSYTMSKRQLDYYGYTSSQEAKDDGMPCDCHYESERQYLLARVIVEAINQFQLP